MDTRRETKKSRSCNPCRVCNGRGWVKVARRHGSLFTRRVTCPECGGSGCNKGA